MQPAPMTTAVCPDVVFFATPPVDGVFQEYVFALTAELAVTAGLARLQRNAVADFQEYVAHEANLCFKLPDNVSTMEGALIEPLAVGFHAANQGGAHAGQTAVVAKNTTSGQRLYLPSRQNLQ